MKLALPILLIICCVSSLLAAKSNEDNPAKSDQQSPLPFPKEFVSSKYLGKWYEAARLPTPAQKDGTLATAEYSVGEKENEIIVFNTAYDSDGKQLANIKGKAQIQPGNPPRLIVSFGPVTPTEPNYFVMYVDEKYQYAVVGRPNRKSLFILARTVPVPQEKLSELVAIAKKAGFDTDKLEYDAWPDQIKR